MSNKCFCHFNGYEVKDATARKHNEQMGVTPQMFGAVGDGITDDTVAIQTAINSSDNVFIPSGNYLVSDSIVIDSAKLFYTADGYTGKKVTGTDATKIVVTSNVPAVIVRGSHSLIENLTLTFSNDIYSEYDSALLQLESLDKNEHKISCNNIFNNIRCLTSTNVSTISGKYSGIGIKLISDGDNSTYQNKFNNCNTADLYKGLVIENGSTTGINGNYFHVDLWNCNYLLETNGDGSVFVGDYQAGKKLTDEENVCFIISGGQNTFNGYIWDTGRFDRTESQCPAMYITGRNNVFSIPFNPHSIGGDIRNNHIPMFTTPGYNDPRIVHGGRIVTNGLGGSAVSVAPYVNSLQNSYITDFVLETENCTIWGAEAVYTELNEDGIPTNIKPLSSNALNKQLTLNVVDGSVIRIKFKMPDYSKIDGVYLYLNNRRMAPCSSRTRVYKDSFGSTDYLETTENFNTTNLVGLTCLTFAPNFSSLSKYSYAEIELRFNQSGMFGMSYISAVIINDLYGPLLNDQ